MLHVFVNAYNRFGEAKRRRGECHPGCGRDFAFCHVDYL